MAQQDSIRQGDFTHLAENYARYRSDYSQTVLRALALYAGACRPLSAVADVGAGTGIWTRMVASLPMRVFAVEPNDAMREQGVTAGGESISWHAGAAESTGLADGCVDWVTMASSFHWSVPSSSLPEFARILRPGGCLTALWNPRAIEGDPFHEGIETMVREIVPELKRVSSGAAKQTQDWGPVLTSTGHFEDPLFMEASHTVYMSRERYLGVWRSVNDIQAQAGPERFAEILRRIESATKDLETVPVPYRTRSWTVRRVG